MKIHLPDKGLILNFPDGMTEDQMRDAINRNFYPEKLSPQAAAPALPQPARAMPELSPQPAAPVLPGVADGDVMPQTAALDMVTPPSTDALDPSYWDLGTIAAGVQKGIAGLDTRKAERADIETARAFRQSNDPTRRPNLLELGMAALSDPSVLEIQDKAKQARAAAEAEAYNSASRAEALRRNAEWWDPGEYHAPTEGVGKVLHDLAVNAPYTLKNMPLAAAATLAAGPYGAIAGSLPGALGEGLDEGAEVYRRLIEKGVNPDEAYKQYLSHADKIGLGLMLSDPLQNMATFGLGKLFPNAGAVTRTLGGLLFSMGSEGAEEVLEGVAANKAVGDPNDWSELGYEGLLGALSGGLFGGGGMAVNAVANAMAKGNAPVATKTEAASEATKGLTFTPEQRGELLRWAHSETGRMAEEAQFAEDGTPENPLSEADLVRYQEIQDAMKRRDYAALAEMRGEAEAAQSAAQPKSPHEDTAMGLAPETAKAIAPRKGRYTDMDEFVVAATSPEGKKIASSMWVELGDISDAAAERVLNDTGIDVTGYAHALDGSGLHHILNRHGVDGKALKTYKNQLAVAESDLKRLPEVVETPDIVEAGRTQPNGNATLIFKKRVNGHYLVVEDVRGSLGKLIPITMWKERAKQKADEGFSHTSETPQTPSRSSSLAESAMPPFETTSLKSGPSVPEPAPASLASTTPTLEPEGGSDWRYENRNLGSTLPPSGEDVNARALEDGENLEGYEQQGVDPAGTAPDQAEDAKAKGPVRPRTPAEIRRLAKDVEARMIAAGRDVKEAKAMGLLASEFAGRFAKRTGIQPAEALDFEMQQGKAQGVQGSGYDQTSVRQSEDYDSGDPKTWPAGPARDEALALEAWQRLEDDDEVETWPGSPEKAEALALQKEYREIEAWVEGHSVEEVLANDELNERGVHIEERLRDLRRDLRKKKPKGTAKRLSQLIEAEEEAAAREAETYYQRHGPLTFKLTGKSVSAEYMAALEKLEAGEPIAAEEYNAIPEIQDARSRTATGSTLNMTDREAIRKQVYDRLMSYGSAVTKVVDGRGRTVYNGEVRNDRRADIIIGLPASGKSSALVDPISSKYKSMLIDSDEAKKLIPEFNDGFGAGYVHGESKDIVGRVYDDVTDEGKNVVIPIVGSSYAKLKDEYIDDLRQKGYKVYVHMADINPNVAAGRNLRRFAETGRFVDLEVTSFKYGNKPREVFERVKKEGVSDGYSRIDTTVFPGRQVEGTEDISHDRRGLRRGRKGVLGSSASEKGRESGRGAAEGLEAERAGGTSQEGMAPRGVSAPNGRTYFLPDGTSVIEFFETANKSTSFHEFGHHIFNKMVEFSGLEGVDPQLAEDVNTILEEAGVSREAFDADTDGAKTKAHEFFSRGFETYLSEGKAPTARLRDAFRRIRNWMIEVYNDTAKALGIKLSDEMRGVYDRLFASDGAFGDIYGAEDVKAGTNAPAQTQETVTTTTRKGVEVDTKVRDTSNDTRMMDLFNSPSVVAKRHAKFRPFFGMAKEAVEKQERMRSNWNKAVDAIYGRKGRGGLLSKDQVSLFNETLLEGDALGKAFSAEELRERGFDTNMTQAYRLVRGLYDNAHRMLSAQRNIYGKENMEYRKGYVPHFFHAWRVLEDGKIVTSFRSMNEAIKAAEKMKKEGENRNIRVAPALDDFGGRGKLDAVTLGDMQYFKLVGNIGKAFELSADEARALLEDTARMKGRSRVFKNAWERKGVAGFDANMEYALRHYLNLSARYIAMDTLKHDGINLFERTFGRFDNDHKGLARYTKDYINDVLGVPSNVEQTLNNWVRNSWLGKYLPNIIGDRPATVAANSIASLTAHCKLGFLNIASAAMNLSQLNGTQAIIGPIWTIKALAEYLHPNQMTLRLYADAGVEENITAENPSGYSKVHQARGLLADTSMMAFRLVDGMARKVTLIGAYRKALSQGMNRSAAIEYAKQVNDDVNFDYSVADAPNFIRRTGPIGTLLFQFKKFPVKMLELALPGVGKLKGWEQARFWAPMVVLSGVFGLPGFDLLKDWLKSIFGKDLELETKKLVAESSLPEPVKRTILYGALSNLGVDVGRRAGMGDFFPSELKDLTGPAAATAARVVESLPKVFDDGNFMDLIEGISPGLANPIKAVMGETRDRRRDRVAFRYKTPGERIARATGARPIREAIENDAMRIARYEQQKRSAAEADAIDDFLRVVNTPGTPKYEAARKRLAELRIAPDRVRAEGMRRRGANGGESTAYERAMRGVRTPRRHEDYRSMQNYAGMWN